MDLKKSFGNRYVVAMDASWEAETPEHRAEFLAKGDEVYYYEIKGRCGMVYLYSKTMIAVVLPTRAARRLVKLMGHELVLLQYADDSMCYKADAKHAEAIVRFIKPQRLRPLAVEHKAALTDRLARYRSQNQKIMQTNSSNVESAPALPGVAS
jgi:hypothetical protein